MDFEVMSGIMLFSIIAFAVIFCLVVAGIIYVWVRNWSALKQQGIDPVTAQSQLIGKLAKSEILAPEKTIEQRLTELTELHARGVINDQELAQARAEVLREG